MKKRDEIALASEANLMAMTRTLGWRWDGRPTAVCLMHDDIDPPIRMTVVTCNDWNDTQLTHAVVCAVRKFRLTVPRVGLYGMVRIYCEYDHMPDPLAVAARDRAVNALWHKALMSRLGSRRVAALAQLADMT